MTSGKIKRFECVKQFTDGTLNVIDDAPQHEPVQPMVTRDPISKSSSIDKKEIIGFLKRLLSEQTGIPITTISTGETLVSYGVDSIGVVRAAQRLSVFLGTPVGAIDIFTATCIEDLADFAENLLIKSQPQLTDHPSEFPQIKKDTADLLVEVSAPHKLGIWLFQLLALTYISILLMFPACLSISSYTALISASHALIDSMPWFGYLVSLACAPLSWMLCMVSTCLTIAFFGKPFLQPNYALTPEISIWSFDFVKWWSLYKVQEISSKALAVHLRGTVYAKYWFKVLGAKIASSVLLDTTEITDPSLVAIGAGAVIAEGALIQSHEVKNSILSFDPVRIGQNSSVGPYAVIQKGSIVRDGAEVGALQKCERGKTVSTISKLDTVTKENRRKEIILNTNENYESLYQLLGIYVVGFVSSLSAATAYAIYLWAVQEPPSLQCFGFFCIFGAFQWLPFSIAAYAAMFGSVTSSPIKFAISVSMAYLAHGLILSFLTCTLTPLLSRILEARTEAFYMYLRLLGAKIGQHCSIRAINPVSDPELIAIGDGVHLGDFSRIVPGFYKSGGFVRGKIGVQHNSVIGSQSLILPGSVIENDVILGALSVAPTNSVLRSGGVFVGCQTPVMVKNIMHILDDRIEEMDTKYKKVLGNLAANLAATTLKVRSRYFHRIGAAGKGLLKLYANIPGLFVHNSVIGSQSLILPGSVIENDVILGALSVAPTNSVLRSGGVFVGCQTPVMVKNIMHILDDRIEEMDTKYKKVLGNLAANLAATTLKVRSRYFHRIGAAGKGLLKLYANIPGFPDHKIFYPGKNYPVVIRHSNCLSSDDDARLDPRGAALRILSDEGESGTPLLDLTLKTGKAFHARTIGDFATWLVCVAAARQEHVKHAPHVREAMWDSLRRADSYAELHYYSNICRLFTFDNGEEMYINEDSGRVEPVGILPPETGAIPRDEKDSRPLIFLAKDFQSRVNLPEGVRYVLQLLIRQIPNDEGTREVALDCTKPWDETEFPYIEVGEITIDQVLKKEESEKLEFNPFLRCQEVDVIRATSCSQSASMDHGRLVVYSICQHLRNRKPLPEAWRIFLDQSDVKVDLSGCPMAAVLERRDVKNVTLARKWHQTLWMMSAQPLLQTVLPYFLVGLVIFAPLKGILYLKETKSLQVYWLLPLSWVSSGVLAGLVCAVAKWVLVGKKKEGESVMIWSRGIFMDTVWQAIRTVVGEYFMDMASGSVLYGLWMKLMGSEVGWDQGIYVDSLGAVLNPEMVRIERHGCVGREALLFGHIYEGEGGKVKFGKICIGDGGFVGSRAVTMPGVTVERGGSLGANSLAMKGESQVKARLDAALLNRSLQT
ncbi:hypothetical protein RJ639_005786 [Escallonia herrerae]|uniref:Carrier domain-containing protein n=1 Tax=Escallonia herrerae TaxID=1293975 RepID=A0AA89AXX9_9ASTE|nr:hypothetical protein RJ639_005786 [Escallonia herrerae]